MTRVIDFIKKEIVLVIAWILAVVSMIFVTPDREYIEYMDFKTLGILFCLMAVMAGLKKCGFFKTVAYSLLKMAGNQQSLEFILVLLCFFFSMLITNDVSLITFVPLALEVLKVSGRDDRVIPVVVMQTIAANLGSMATPIGNPHNLYLYSKSGLSAGEFIAFMLPYTLIALGLIIITMLIWSKKNEKLTYIGILCDETEQEKKKLYREVIYLILFALCVLVVVNVIPVHIMVVMILILFLILDRKVLVKIDYSLLLTFVGFFIFVGNIGRINELQNMLYNILKGNEFIIGALLSQVISNVPASILLSGFTSNWKNLVIGTNIGGLGTLIASMASLISFKLVTREYSDKKGKYFVKYTAVNVLLLIIMIMVYFLKEELC